LGVTVGLLAYLLHRAGVGSIVSRLAHANLYWLAAGYSVAALSIAATIFQWWALLRDVGLRRSLKRCARMELAGDVFDAALPTSVGGDVFRAGFAADDKPERSVAATSVLLRRICNFPGMVVVLLASLAASAGASYAGRIRPYSVVAAGVGTVAVLVCFSPLLGRIAKMPVLERSGLGRFVGKVLGALHDFRGRGWKVAAAAGRGVVFWVLAGVSQWCFMHAVGIHVSLAYGLLVVTTTTAITMLPISVGGYGLREGSFSAFLAVGGLASPAQGVAVGVCLTAQTILLGIVGLPFYARSTRRPVATEAGSIDAGAAPSGSVEAGLENEDAQCVS
jgi:uncharacterized membrane protein YbhN (UPF0104 family)